MVKMLGVLLVVTSMIGAIFFSSFATAAPLIDLNEIGFDGKTRDNNFDTLLNAYYSNTNVIQVMNNNLLWVPWYKTSSGSKISDLQSGGNCNSGQTIDYTHNCMVTDEYSQVGVVVAMGKDQNRMNQFYNTVIATKSKFGNIPSWRIYRDGNTIEACKSGINSNCDTASDATARIIISLFTASKNPYFTDSVQKTNYKNLGVKLADDMLSFEVDKTCRKTNYGTVCHWLAGGSQVKIGGIASSDFAYTGYYPDAIIAMLQAYANTNDIKYYNAAKDFTLNYMQAAKFDNQKFTAPPGKSFKWVVDSSGTPQAECTNTCSPVIWDSYDASRALGMCQANYYAKEMGVDLPYLQKYCELLTARHMGSTTSTPLQFYPDGSAGNMQSGYFAQGLQSLHFSGVNANSFKSCLNSALAHYNPSTKTFDNAESIGIYTTAFAIRALGMGIGRDLPSFGGEITIPSTTTPTVPIEQTPTVPEEKLSSPTSPTEPTTTPSTDVNQEGIASLKVTCAYGATNTAGALKSDVTSGACRTVVWGTSQGDIKVLGCEKDGDYVEIYEQQAPLGITHKACFANGCVSQDSGFARFIPVVSPSTAPKTNTTTSESTNAKATNSSVTAFPVIIPPVAIPVVMTSMAALTPSCVYGNVNKNAIIKSDVTSGVCRTVIFGTNIGDIKVLVCKKDGDYVELYMQSAPSGLKFNACLENGCVNKDSGFARYIPTEIQVNVPSSEPIATPAQPTIEQTQPQESTEDVNYNRIGLLDVSCTNGQIQSDVTSGVCRTVVFSTSNGNVQIYGCEKDSNYVEVYRQEYPANYEFRACMGDGCVDKYGGFARFQTTV
jgi:hypothetical protein